MRQLPSHARRRAASLFAFSLASVLALPAGSAGAQRLGPGTFTLHGYATQGWAATNGAQHYGMTSQGSADFRYAALQLRYDAGANGLLVQLHHRSLGDSPIEDFERPVRLNWAFYERSFNGGAVKLGRVPVPRGIFNEQRSAGVLLPLYRQPVVFYDEAAYYSETIDGAVASYTVRDGEPWSLDAHLYGGSWKLLAYESSDEEYLVSQVKATNALGAQLWLNTSLEGLRVGLAAQRYDWRNVAGDEEAFQEQKVVHEIHGSVDFVRPRGFARAEAQAQRFPDDLFVPWYVQAGVNVGPKLTLVGQFEKASDLNQTYAADWPSDVDWHRSVTAGVRYAIRPSLVAKLEHHWDRGVQVEQPVNPLNPARFRYVIASLSASF